MQISPSQRLNYRLLDPLNPTDQALLLQLDQDPQVMRYINGGQPSTPEHMQQVLLPRLATYTQPDQGWGMWGVFQSDSQTFCGWVLVRPMHFFSTSPDDSDLELGWRFKQALWGQGIATEAAQHIAEALHQQRGILRFSAIAVAENQGSIRVMQKLGMTFVKSGLHRDPLGDMQVDTYSMTFPPSSPQTPE